MDGLEREFKNGIEREKAMYKIRQERIGQSVKALGLGTKTSNGLGELVSVIDARTYFRFLQMDKDFWLDDVNVKNYERDNPECLVKNWNK